MADQTPLITLDCHETFDLFLGITTKALVAAEVLDPRATEVDTIRTTLELEYGQMLAGALLTPPGMRRCAQEVRRRLPPERRPTSHEGQLVYAKGPVVRTIDVPRTDRLIAHMQPLKDLYRLGMPWLNFDEREDLLLRWCLECISDDLRDQGFFEREGVYEHILLELKESWNSYRSLPLSWERQYPHLRVVK